MPKFLDRTNKRYGRLTVVKCCGKDNRGKYLWLCKCDCGNTKIVCADNLSSGKSKSCGCIKREFLKKRGNQWGLYEDRELAMLKVQYSHLKRRHNKNKMSGVLLDFEDFKKKVMSKCYYCGLEFSKTIEDRLNETKSSKKLSNTILKINGIDRKDNNIGYTKENTVPCCKFCNFAKHTMNENEFKQWIKRAYENIFYRTTE